MFDIHVNDENDMKMSVLFVFEKLMKPRVKIKAEYTQAEKLLLPHLSAF